MRTVLLALACMFMASHSHAISRYDIQSMSCAQVQSVLRNERAAILRYRSARSGVPLYGRYVHSGAACEMGQRAERRYVPAADNSRCEVRECIYNDNTSFR